ncbi:MAG: response regulator transcription factor [Gammaproteobacteria bacterium]|nr:response regulator transcription factor [Gammaproteobacteria bacterium]
MRILIVEDEEKLAALLQQALTVDHHAVTVSFSGEDGFYLINTDSFDLIVLDIMLPGRDGLEILRTVRAQGVHTPILMLTARDSVDDRVLGLDAGADDYIVKPFAMSELRARIRALARRGNPDEITLLNYQDIELNLITRSVLRAGKPIDLTTKEFELLECLLRHRQHIVSREMLARIVWKSTARATPLDNVIDVHMARLRKKIDEPFAPSVLHTVRGLGFVLK